MEKGPISRNRYLNAIVERRNSRVRQVRMLVDRHTNSHFVFVYDSHDENKVNKNVTMEIPVNSSILLMIFPVYF